MGVPNLKGNRQKRLENKTLDSQFLTEVQEGMNCSPFEANAILEIVKEVYFPFLDESAVMAPPGKITLIAVGADEPAGKPVADCEKVTVCLTLHRGPNDDQILDLQGPTAFRRSRIPELCQQALSQGALLTREDLAAHVFFVSPRTISRDLAFLRKEQPGTPVPLRSIIQDIGPMLTHRVEIVRLALQGKTMSEIRDITNHSPAAISNYVSTFTRCAQLAEKKMKVEQIAFLLRRSVSLTRNYLELFEQCKNDANMNYHLQEILNIGTLRGEKKSSTEEGSNGSQG